MSKYCQVLPKPKHISTEVELLKRENLKNPEDGGWYFFWGGIDHFHIFLKECIWNVFLGGLSQFYLDFGGSAVLMEEKPKWGERLHFRVNFLLAWFFWVASQNFPLKNVSHEVDLEGGSAHWDTAFLGGQIRSVKNGGVSIYFRMAPNWYTLPLGFLCHLPNINTSRGTKRISSDECLHF